MRTAPVALIALATLAPRIAAASACCAGISAAPAMISGDQARQLGLSVSHGSIVADSDASGQVRFRSGGASEVSETIALDAATLVSDRWQLGVSESLIRKSIEAAAIRGASTGIGDLRLNVAFEALPEYEYSVFRPRGFVFLQGTLPLGRSTYDSVAPGAVDARGQGFFSASLGAFLNKRWSGCDAFLLPEVHASPGRTFVDANDSETRVHAHWGASAALGGGYSPGTGDLRLGLRLAPSWQSARALETELGPSTRSEQLNWSATLEVSYMPSSDWAVSAAYTDQTLFGPARNGTLSRTLALGIQRKWER